MDKLCSNTECDDQKNICYFFVLKYEYEQALLEVNEYEQALLVVNEDEQTLLMMNKPGREGVRIEPGTYGHLTCALTC
jgi:hypothetical protein